MNMSTAAWDWIEADRKRQMERMEQIRREQEAKKRSLGR